MPTEKLTNISGQYHLEQSVIKSEIVYFNPGSKLIFTDINAPYWLIWADEIKLNMSGKGNYIGKDRSFSWPPLPQAPSGQNAKNVHFYIGNGRDGAHGLSGAQGQPGIKGAVVDLPPLYIIANSVSFTDDKGNHMRDANTLVSNLTIDMSGITSQEPSLSGNGGHGSNGLDGLAGNSKALKCRYLPGRGGNAGGGSLFGPPADGTRGGDAGHIYLVGAADFIRTLSYANILQQGGLQSAPGKVGDLGAPGRKGSRGSRKGWCQHVADDGVEGQIPKAHFPKVGNIALPGSTGSLIQKTIPALKSLVSSKQ